MKGNSSKLLKVPLNGTWKLADFAPGEKKGGDLSGADISGWMNAAVPGDVHDVLIGSGRLPDLFYGDNVKKSGIVRERDWFYARDLTVDSNLLKKRTELVFRGVDTFAQVWLNGRLLGGCRDMFLEYSFDVTDILKAGTANRLILHFEEFNRRLPEKEREYGDFRFGRYARLGMRKSQCQFGWDWAPFVPGVGIWKDVELVSYDEYRIDYAYVRTNMTGQVDIFTKLNKALADGSFVFEVSGHGWKQKTVIPASGERTFCSFVNRDPELWFPAGYGPQPLYDYRVGVLDRSGSLLDEKTGRFGIRTVETFEEPFEPHGLGFGIKVNGIRVFCKGGNWVPADIFPQRLKEGDYRRFLGRAREANFNMLRVWGGGIYEPGVFYDLCDEWGIMVWQDFMFGGMLKHPHGYSFDDEGFRQLVISEAYQQLTRLRNHPCIVIWCGCNEDIGSFGPKEGFGEEMFSVTLAGMTREMSHGIPYVQSSPQSYTDMGWHPNSGNNHDSAYKYAFRHGIRRYREYFEKPFSFDSEFTAQGPCRRTSFERFMPACWPPDELWRFRVMIGNSREHHEKLVGMSGDLFGPIRSLDDYFKFGMAMQAEMTRSEYEGARRHKWSCGGTMSWMYNDCWPAADWSIIDHYGVPKPAFYAAKRACSPVIAAISVKGGEYEVFLSNDSRGKYKGELVAGQETLDGSVLWQKKVSVSLKANVSKVCMKVKDSSLKKAKDSYLYAVFKANKKKISDTTFFPYLWHDIQWPDPGIEYRIVSQKKDSEGMYNARVELKVKKFARMAHVDVIPLESCIYSDNFFDMRPKERKTVEIRSPRRLKSKDILIGHWLTVWR